MQKQQLHKILCFFLLSSLFILSPSCSREKKSSIEITYFDWHIEKAFANIMKVLLEKQFDCEITLIPITSAGTWSSISIGTSDIAFNAWLPTTHGYYYENTKNKIDIIHPNYEGVRIGLVVPTYVKIDSIEEILLHKEQFQNEIIGIEPGAGMMITLEKAIEEYNLQELTLVDSCQSVMVNLLSQKIKRKEWVVVPACYPHEMFYDMDIKFLKDPKNVFGNDEKIYTIARRGFQDDFPEVYTFLKNVRIEDEQIDEIMQSDWGKDKEYYKKAVEWVDTHSEIVQKWI